MLLRTAKSCGPDAPTLVSRLRMLCRPYRVRMQCKFANDGGKRARSPGRARRKPLKPLRAGTSGDSGVLVVTRVRSTTTKCTRDRGCNGHPAFPTPSLGGRFTNASGAWRREDEGVSGIRVPSLRGAKRRSNPYFLCGEMDCFASLAMTMATHHTLNRHRPRKRAIQYSETPMIESRATAYWILRFRGV